MKRFFPSSNSSKSSRPPSSPSSPNNVTRDSSFNSSSDSVKKKGKLPVKLSLGRRLMKSDSSPKLPRFEFDHFSTTPDINNFDNRNFTDIANNYTSKVDNIFPQSYSTIDSLHTNLNLPLELIPIVTLLTAQSHRRYQKGVISVLHDLSGFGTPAKREWTQYYAILVGTQLTLLDAQELLDLQKAQINGTKNDSKYRSQYSEKTKDALARPKYLNLTDATIRPLDSDEDVEICNHIKKTNLINSNFDTVLVLSTTLKNRYLLQFNDKLSYIRWTAAIRLSLYESHNLQEAYTGALLSCKGKLMGDITTVLLSHNKLSYCEWVFVRFGTGTSWKRFYAVVEQSNSKKQPKGTITFFENDKKLKKKHYFARVTDARTLFAIYPSCPALIDSSTIMKLEGNIEYHSKGDNNGSQTVFIMAEKHKGVPCADTLIRFMIPAMNAFKLYGRPNSLTANRSDPNSLMFGLPTLPSIHYLWVNDIVELIKISEISCWKNMDWKKNIDNLLKLKINEHNYTGCGMRTQRSILYGAPKIEQNEIFGDRHLIGSMVHSSDVGKKENNLSQKLSVDLVGPIGGSSDDSNGPILTQKILYPEESLKVNESDHVPFGFKKASSMLLDRTDAQPQDYTSSLHQSNLEPNLSEDTVTLNKFTLNNSSKPLKPPMRSPKRNSLIVPEKSVRRLSEVLVNHSQNELTPKTAQNSPASIISNYDTQDKVESISRELDYHIPHNQTIEVPEKYHSPALIRSPVAYFSNLPHVSSRVLSAKSSYSNLHIAPDSSADLSKSTSSIKGDNYELPHETYHGVIYEKKESKVENISIPSTENEIKNSPIRNNVHDSIESNLETNIMISNEDDSCNSNMDSFLHNEIINSHSTNYFKDTSEDSPIKRDDMDFLFKFITKNDGNDTANEEIYRNGTAGSFTDNFLKHNRTENLDLHLITSLKHTFNSEFNANKFKDIGDFDVFDLDYEEKQQIDNLENTYSSKVLYEDKNDCTL